MKVQSWISYLHQFRKCLSRAFMIRSMSSRLSLWDFLWDFIQMQLVLKEVTISPKNGISFETIFFLSNSAEYLLPTFLNIWIFFVCHSPLPPSPKSQLLITISLHVCYQHLNAVMAFFTCEPGFQSWHRSDDLLVAHLLFNLQYGAC